MMPTLTDWNPYYLTFSDGRKLYVPSNVRVLAPTAIVEGRNQLVIRLVNQSLTRRYGLVTWIGDSWQRVVDVLRKVANA